MSSVLKDVAAFSPEKLKKTETKEVGLVDFADNIPEGAPRSDEEPRRKATESMSSVLKDVAAFSPEKLKKTETKEVGLVDFADNIPEGAPRPDEEPRRKATENMSSVLKDVAAFSPDKLKKAETKEVGLAEFVDAMP